MKIINALNDYIYIYEDGKVVKKNLSKEKGIITSFLYSNDIFTLTKKFHKQSIKSEDEIIIEMEKYIFSYPNIDLNKDYKIIYINTERGDEIFVEALLIEEDILKNKFQKILNIFKYIDFISPSFLAWGEYYKATKTEYKNDIFIYFDENDAFLSAFNEGKYIFHKSLNKFDLLLKATNLSKDELKNILKIKGLDRSKYDDENLFIAIDRFFSEFFLKVFNIINYSLNEYKLSKFNRIFFYSPFEINSLFEQYQNYWNLNDIEFKELDIQTEYNKLEYLITLFNANNYQKDDINFSFFKKPPLFITTKAGQFISFILVNLLLVGGFAGYEFYNINKIQKQNELFQKKINIYEKKYNTYLKISKLLHKKIDNINKDIIKINKEIGNINLKIFQINNAQKQDVLYNVIVKITIFMKKHDLRLQDFSKQKNHYSITVICNSHNIKNITEFMKDLINSGFKNVTSKTIQNKQKEYISYVDFING